MMICTLRIRFVKHLFVGEALSVHVSKQYIRIGSTLDVNKFIFNCHERFEHHILSCLAPIPG